MYYKLQKGNPTKDHKNGRYNFDRLKKKRQI